MFWHEFTSVYLAASFKEFVISHVCTTWLHVSVYCLILCDILVGTGCWLDGRRSVPFINTLKPSLSESQLWSTLRAWSEPLFLPFLPVKSNVTLGRLAVPVEVITFLRMNFLDYTKWANNPPANNYIIILFYVHGESLKNGRKSKRRKSKMIIPPEISD